MKKVFQILFLISFCIALIPASCGVAAGFWYMKNKDWKEHAVKVNGTVVELIEESDKSGLQWRPVVEYTYKGKTKKYTSTQSSSPKPYEEGETVTMLINPEDPKDSCIDAIGEVYIGPMVLGLMTLPFAIIIFPLCFIFLILAIVIKKRDPSHSVVEAS